MQVPYIQEFLNKGETYTHDASYSFASTRDQFPSLDEAIKQTQEFLLSKQIMEGYWWASLESNATITAETVVLIKILGVEADFPLEKMKNYLLKTQKSHGGWERSCADGGEISVSVEAYMALKLLGLAETHPNMEKARQFIQNKGGVMKSRVFTKILLALIGCYDWEGVPSLPPWLILLPSWSYPTSIYEMSSWARGCVVPLLVIADKKPIFRISLNNNNISNGKYINVTNYNDNTAYINFDELYVKGSTKKAHFGLKFKSLHWTNLFILGDYMMKLSEKFGLVPFRERALRAAEEWVLQHQEDSGDWGAIFPATFYSILCLKVRGYKTGDPVIRRGLQGIKGFSVETATKYSIQVTPSPVWDTALVVRSLAESGIRRDHPALQRAGEWLLANQILQKGDWWEKNRRGVPGGWSFQFVNKCYPDIDDTAVVIMALNEIKLENEEARRGAIRRGVKWVDSMQCTDGGWAAYDRDNNQAWLNEIPFADMKAMLDPSTVDVTARVMEMAGRLAEPTNLAGMKKALRYLKREQEQDGSWFGRWGVNYIYGTSGVIVALALVFGKECSSEIRRAAKWLVEVQNNSGRDGDGGWGEDVRSYESGEFKGRGPSTAAQTAWAIIGLLAAGDVLGYYELEAIEMGVGYLLRTQRSDGSWFDPWFTGTGFPGHMYLRYHYYAIHFPLTALARYRLRFRSSVSNP